MLANKLFPAETRQKNSILGRKLTLFYTASFGPTTFGPIKPYFSFFVVSEENLNFNQKETKKPRQCHHTSRVRIMQPKQSFFLPPFNPNIYLLSVEKRTQKNTQNTAHDHKVSFIHTIRTDDQWRETMAIKVIYFNSIFFIITLLKNWTRGHFLQLQYFYDMQFPG